MPPTHQKTISIAREKSMTLASRDFQTLLAESGIEFTPLPDFVPCPVRENSVFYYQYAERSTEGDMEMRYHVNSLHQLEAQRKTASEGVEMLVSVSLDKLYLSNFMAILFNLSNGIYTEARASNPRTTAILFNADWSAISYLRLANNDFSQGYNSACLLAIHKSGIADITVIGLYNDTSGNTERIFMDDLPSIVKQRSCPSLRFT
jgi:hypothetical protein